MLRKANIACNLNAKRAYEIERKALMEGGEEALQKRQQRLVLR